MDTKAPREKALLFMFSPYIDFPLTITYNKSSFIHGFFMTRSMTAYGRSVVETLAGSFLIEISSINRKHLDTHVHLPKELGFLDPTFRQWMKQIAHRGNISIKLTKSSDSKSRILPNVDSLKRLKNEMQDLSHQLDISSDISLEMLLNYYVSFGGESAIKDEKLFMQQIKKGFDEACRHWLHMKSVEGKALYEDIYPKSEEILNYLSEIERRTANAVEKYKDKLIKRLKDFEVFSDEDIEKVHKEAVIYADRVDVNEEIIRLKSHVSQMQNLLKQEKSIGKTLEFLLQEMLRETNSLGVKCQDGEIIHFVIEIKGLLEKMREQVQNVE